MTDRLDAVTGHVPQPSDICTECGNGLVHIDSRNDAAHPVSDKAEAGLDDRLRQFLWLNHGHGEQLYGDDGEMHCRACLPTWDYRRAPMADVIEAAEVAVGGPIRRALAATTAPATERDALGYTGRTTLAEHAPATEPSGHAEEADSEAEAERQNAALDARLAATEPSGERDEALNLLNSLGIYGPNIIHAEQGMYPDGKQSADDTWDGPGSCVCGLPWPCEAKRLGDLIAALDTGGPARRAEPRFSDTVGMPPLRDEP